MFRETSRSPRGLVPPSQTSAPIHGREPSFDTALDADHVSIRGVRHGEVSQVATAISVPERPRNQALFWRSVIEAVLGRDRAIFQRAFELHGRRGLEAFQGRLAVRLIDEACPAQRRAVDVQQVQIDRACRGKLHRLRKSDGAPITSTMPLDNRSMLLPLLGFILLVVMVFGSVWLANQQQQSFRWCQSNGNWSPFGRGEPKPRRP